VGGASLDFAELPRSLHADVGGTPKAFSTRADFIGWLVAHGHLGGPHDFAKQPDVVEAVYRHWQGQGQVACRFAQQMGRAPEKYGIRTAVSANLDEGKVTDATKDWLGDVVSGACQDAATEALTLLFPTIDDPAALVRFLRSLADVSGWYLNAELNPSDRLGRVYVRVHVAVCEDGVAEVLGFGPFDFLPLTRRAPIVALEIRTKKNQPKAGSGPGKPLRLHLADMPLGWEQDHVRKVWELTEQSRRATLGGDDSAAKAKVTYAIPQPVWAAP